MFKGKCMQIILDLNELELEPTFYDSLQHLDDNKKQSLKHTLTQWVKDNYFLPKSTESTSIYDEMPANLSPLVQNLLSDVSLPVDFDIKNACAEAVYQDYLALD